MIESQPSQAGSGEFPGNPERSGFQQLETSGVRKNNPPGTPAKFDFDLPLIGAQYWRAPTPTEPEWEGDLDQLSQLGLEAIQLRVQWAWHERGEGEYDFREVTRLMDLAHARGLRTIVMFMLEDAPYWLFENYDAARVAPDGRVIPPAAGSAYYSGLALPCFDSPLVRRKAEGFIRGLTEATRRHPSLILYSLWNEIRSRPYGQCACPHSRRRFHAWLKQRHGGVDELNRALGKDFGEFAHFRPPATTQDVTSALLWRTWAQESLVDVLRWVTSTIRRVGARAPVVVHTGMNNMINNALGDSTCDRLNAAVVDVYGHSGVFWDGRFRSYSDIQGKATRENPHWRAHQYVLSLQDNWTRNVAPGRVPANYEVYANDYGANREDFGPEEMNDFFLTSLSEGVKLLLLWQFKAERIGFEAGACGLVELDNTPTARAGQVGRIVRFAAAHRELLAGYAPEPGRVAIVYDNNSDIISKLAEHGEAGDTITDQYRYKNNLKGWYRLFWDANVPADIFPAEHLGNLTNYQVVVLPAMVSVSRRVRETVLAFAAAGGKLIVDCGFDSREGNGWGKVDVPGKDFVELFGGLAARKQLYKLHGELGSPFGSLPTGNFVTRLSLNNGPWGSCRTGRAMYFAFNPGEARFLHPSADFTPFYAWLGKWTGLQRRWGLLRVRRGASDDKQVWFVHNLGQTPADHPLAGAQDIFNGADVIAPDAWAVLVK